MKALSFVFLCVAGPICSAQVTYTTSGATVEDVVSELARQSGEKLATDKEIAREIVVVAVKDVSAEEFRRVLADCVSGKWVKKEDGWLELRVDAALSAERRRTAQKELAASVQGRISSTRQIYTRSFATEREGTWAENLQICLDILQTLPESVFEDVLPMSRVVLSTTPSKGQRQLGNVANIVGKYLPEVEIQSVKISIERQSHWPFLTAAAWIHEVGGNFHQGTIALVELDKPIDKLPGKPIEWSASSLELARTYGSWDERATAGMVTLSQRLRDELSKPTRIDPISFGFGEGMIAIARDRGANLIASASDDDIQGARAHASEGATTGDYWARIKRTETLTTGEANGWITVRPKDPIIARTLRGDRTALETLISKAKGRSWVDLDDLVDFACSNLNCSGIPGAFVLPFQAMVNYYGVTGESYVSGDFRALQFYGTLGVSQRQRLRNGEELLVSQMPLKSRSVLSSLFSEPGRVIPSLLRVEPTSAMPDGLPATLRVAATAKNSSLLCPLPDAGESTSPSRAKSVVNLAQERWLRKHDDNPNSALRPELVRVLIGSRTLWEFSVVNGNQVYATMQVADDQVPKGAEPVLMDQLPEGIKKEIDIAYEEFVKLMGGGG